MILNFLLCLFVISVCDVQCTTSDGHSVRMALCDDEGHDFHRFFQYDDARTTCVRYQWDGAKELHSGVLSIDHKEEQKNLSIVMDYDGDVHSLLQTQICYKHSASEKKKVATASSVLFKQLLPTEQKGSGSVKIVSPGNGSVVWPIVVYDMTRRPRLCATVVADDKSLNLTRYIFHAEEACDAFFVRVCVRYQNLHMANLSWGTEKICGVSAHGDQANLALAGKQIVNFWQ